MLWFKDWRTTTTIITKTIVLNETKSIFLVIFLSYLFFWEIREEILFQQCQAVFRNVWTKYKAFFLFHCTNTFNFTHSLRRINEWSDQKCFFVLFSCINHFFLFLGIFIGLENEILEDTLDSYTWLFISNIPKHQQIAHKRGTDSSMRQNELTILTHGGSV